MVGIYKLLRRDVSEEGVNAASLLLNLFVNQFEDLYSDRELSSNIHSLCHLGLCVKRHGPLSCNSAFPFEGMNGLVAKATHGTLHVGKEIVNNIKICQGVKVLEKITEGINDLSPVLKTFLDSEHLGTEVQVDLSDDEMSMFQGKQFHIFSRARVGCETFTSEIHKNLKSANFYVMWKSHADTNENTIGVVKFFAVISGKLHACLKHFKIDHLSAIFHDEAMTKVEHLIPVIETTQISLVRLGELSQFEKLGKCCNFMYRRPNLLHQVM